MSAPLAVELPDHTQLPCTDGLPMQNTIQPSQMMILTLAARPHLLRRHPDGQFLVACDHGVYYDHTDPPLDGCKVPDWLYVPDVPPLLDGAYRRSYVLWKEHQPPLVVVEFPADVGHDERDATPPTGKFWVYERVIKAKYYAIHEETLDRLEVYELVGGQYQLMPPNVRGHYPIPEMGVELGLWHGPFDGYTLTWMRFFDANGDLLPLPEELATQERRAKEAAEAQAIRERRAKEAAEARAAQERQAKEAAEAQSTEAQERAARMAAKLRALGIDPDQVA